MKIYTKTGDQGETSLFAGPRVRKDDTRIEAYGTVDELNSVLGWARSEGPSEAVDQVLGRLQQELLVVGSQLAVGSARKQQTPEVGPDYVSRLEQEIDQFDKSLPALTQFILPGGTRASAALHLARTICRRAERRVVSLAAMPDRRVAPLLIAYLNRLGDLLFVLARAANAEAGLADVLWSKPDDS